MIACQGGQPLSERRERPKGVAAMAGLIMRPEAQCQGRLNGSTEH